MTTPPVTDSYTCTLCKKVEPPFTGWLGGRPVVRDRTLGCGHLFHAACVNRWLYDHRLQCPECNQVDESDFLVTEDPHPPRGFRRFFVREGGSERVSLARPHDPQHVVDLLVRSSFKDLEQMNGGSDTYEATYQTAPSGKIYQTSSSSSSSITKFHVCPSGQVYSDLEGGTAFSKSPLV